ncbi:ORF6N domain-containing protein [Coxiella burnetii]|uniref:ORF6N domain-containing protein n=1 Tax=Coxiella burnetii TaxID=777 RepID=UPI0009B6242E|nr:ORF6N domain-containing protein [Coxiella burnetii]PHH57976.1 DNA-binding protein [Coxiella burnetii]
MKMSQSAQIVTIIERQILLIRGEKVILDADLAKLYGVETKVLVQAVKRNKDRFPSDFMFQLSQVEFSDLRSQFVTSTWGGRRYPPYAFTEQGVAMLSSVLRSSRAVAVNIEIMRTFVKLRRLLDSNDKLRKKLEALEQKYDEQFNAVFKVIRQLMEPQVKKTRPIGFVWPHEESPADVKGTDVDQPRNLAKSVTVE